MSDHTHCATCDSTLDRIYRNRLDGADGWVYVCRYDICAYFCAFLPIYTVMVLASHLPVSSRPIWPPSRIGAAWLLSFAVTLRRLQFPDSGGYILG